MKYYKFRCGCVYSYRHREDKHIYGIQVMCNTCKPLFENGRYDKVCVTNRKPKSYLAELIDKTTVAILKLKG